MNSATTMLRAGEISVLVTQDGAHTAHDWAVVTASQLVSVAPDMAPERRILANALRVKVRDMLKIHFRAIRPGMTTAAFDSTVRSAISGVAAASRETPWEESFAQPQIAAMMAEVIRRNLNSAVLQPLAKE